MNVHVMDLPKKVVVGVGVINNVGKYLEELGFSRSKCLIVTGPHVKDIAAKKVATALESRGFRCEVFIAKSPTIHEAKEASEAALGVDVVLGVGGGKAIDVAKYAAYKAGKPFISVPTAPSHDGIASPFASLKGFEAPLSVKAKEPIAVIADAEIIALAPKRLFSAGAGDLIAKLTAVKDWRLAHLVKGEYFGAYAASLAKLSALHVMKYSEAIARKNIESARILIEALISSGVAMCVAGSTRPASGSEHLFSHALDIVAPKPALHGEQVGVGAIMMMYLHGGKWRRLRDALKKLGAPTNAKELGIDEYYIIKALTMAHAIRPERYTILGDRGLTWRAAEKLAQATGVIS